MKLLNTLYRDDAGFVISAELVLVLTIAVLAMVVGLSEVAVAVNTELNDVSNAIGHMAQSYQVTGFVSQTGGKLKSCYSGSTFFDAMDDCDINTTCQLVIGTQGNTHEGGRF
jgi:hypothetical protein